MLLNMSILVQNTSSGTEFDTYKPDKTGMTDVSEILQQAVEQAAKTDKILVLSPGKYWISKPVNIQGNGFTVSSKYPVSTSLVVLQGYKAGTAKKVLQSSDSPPKPEAFFNIKKPSYNLTVAGIAFDYAMVGIKGDYALACAKIKNCVFTNCDYGIKADPIQIVTISGCGFNSGKFGIRGRDMEGPRLNRSNLINIYDCTFRSFSEYAIQIEGSPTNIRDCDFEHNQGGAVELLDNYVSNIVGCYFESSSDEHHPLIRISPCQLQEKHNGQLNIYGNQINTNNGKMHIYVAKGCKLHAYDNRVATSLSKGQVFVHAEQPGPQINVENNIISDPTIP